MNVSLSCQKAATETEEAVLYLPDGAITNLTFTYKGYDITVEGSTTRYYNLDIYETKYQELNRSYSMLDIENYIKEKAFDMMYGYLPNISASEITILPEVTKDGVVVEYGISTQNEIAEVAIVDYYKLVARIDRTIVDNLVRITIHIVSEHHYQNKAEGDLAETVTAYYPTGVQTDYSASYILDTAYTATESYYDKTNKISYRIPNSLKTVTIYDESIISYGAFMNMSYLESESINSEITEIQDYAFYMDYNLHYFDGNFDATSASTRALDRFATMPDEVILIGNYAFYNDPEKHESLFDELTLNQKVESLGSYAFYGWNHITYLDVPASVTAIGSHTFAYNTLLEKVDNQSIVFGEYMFSHDITLDTFNSSTDEIIVIGAQYLQENMPQHIFEYCDSIQAIDIQNHYIAECMFFQCRNVLEIYIKPCVEIIEKGAFAKNVSLENIYYTKADFNYTDYYLTADHILDVDRMFADGLLEYFDLEFTLEGKTTYTYNNTSLNTTASHLNYIGAFAFQETLISKFDVPETTEYIGEGAIKGCQNIDMIYMPFIGSKINNQNVIDAVFGWIFGRLFVDESSTNPNGTKSPEGIDNTIDDSETYNLLTNPELFYPVTQAYTNVHLATFFLPVKIKTVIITKEVTVGRGAFYNCTGLEHIWLPQDSLRQIQHEAFYNCKSLKEMVIPNQITSILEHTFAKCASLEYLQIPYVGKSASANGIESVFGVLFGTEEYEGSYAAEQLYRKEMKQEHVTLYEEGVIRYYIPHSLKMVIIPNTNMTTIPYGAFSNCSEIERIEITGAVRYIGNYAFFNCASLYDYKVVEDENQTGIHEIGFSETIREIGDFAFSGCVSMSDMILSPVLQSIGRYAFQDMTITELLVPNTCTSIGENMLKGCYNLETLSVPMIANTYNEPTIEVLGHFFGTGKEYIENLYTYSQFHQYLYDSILSEAKTMREIAAILGVDVDSFVSEEAL
ncbi:MAG TPA: hypothetical protein DEB74_05310, partial [Lachnospiraceae bacterium]|nr:hypothetical protein [Lachnospiraceae bacterium]